MQNKGLEHFRCVCGHLKCSESDPAEEIKDIAAGEAIEYAVTYLFLTGNGLGNCLVSYVSAMQSGVITALTVIYYFDIARKEFSKLEG